MDDLTPAQWFELTLAAMLLVCGVTVILHALFCWGVRDEHVTQDKHSGG